MGKFRGMYMNGKVLAGLGVVGLGVWAVAPNLIGAAVPILLIAVCPLSMLLMMRGMGSSTCATQPTPTSQPMLVEGTRAEQLAELKAHHAAIAQEIAQLEAASGSTPVAWAEHDPAPERRVAVH